VDAPRERLEADRRDALVRLRGLTGDYDSVVAASYDDNADDEHDPEGATIAFERSQIGALIQQVRRHLAAIDAAVAKLDAGAYGVCESCGDSIDADRLAVRPASPICIRCATGRR
jgi:DnaK suppressor protein